MDLRRGRRARRTRVVARPEPRGSHPSKAGRPSTPRGGMVRDVQSLALGTGPASHSLNDGWPLEIRTLAPVRWMKRLALVLTLMLALPGGALAQSALQDYLPQSVRLHIGSW